MNFLQFKDVMEYKHPTIKVVEGPPRRYDDHQNDYITIVMGGVKAEGEEMPLYAATMPEAIKAWWVFFEQCLTDVVEIHVRRPPEVREEIIQVLDTYYHSKPTLVDVTRYSVIGRFTFYTQEQIDDTL